MKSEQKKDSSRVTLAIILIVLIVLGGLFLAPEILVFPHITLSFIFPAILIGAGIALIAKIYLKE